MTDIAENSGTQETASTQTPAEGTPNTTAATTPNTNTPNQQQPNTNTTVAPSWRGDWREAMAKGDQKELERLARFTSPEAVYDFARNVEKKMSSQRPTPTLPENATPEQLAEYRKQVGVPEKFEGYYEKLPDGLVIGDEDRPAMDMLAERLHGMNVTPDVVNAVIDTYYKIQEKNQQEALEYQADLKRTSSDTLRKEWGGDYRANINAIKAMLDGLDTDTRNLIEGAQLADGSLAFNHPQFMRWMGSLALQINPAAIVVPGNSGTDRAQSVKDKIEENLAMMKKDINVWQHKSNSARREEHYKLLDAAHKLGLNY